MIYFCVFVSFRLRLWKLAFDFVLLVPNLLIYTHLLMDISHSNFSLNDLAFLPLTIFSIRLLESLGGALFRSTFNLFLKARRIGSFLTLDDSINNEATLLAFKNKIKH